MGWRILVNFIPLARWKLATSHSFVTLEVPRWFVITFIVGEMWQNQKSYIYLLNSKFIKYFLIHCQNNKYYLIILCIFFYIHCILKHNLRFVCLMVFNATFNNISAISWLSVLLVEETEEREKTTDLSQVTDKLDKSCTPYICNQCISSLMLWVWISIKARCTWFVSKVCYEFYFKPMFFSIIDL
jgi:hypothetical protein